jgi:hypothetical protein
MGADHAALAHERELLARERCEHKDRLHERRFTLGPH